MFVFVYFSICLRMNEWEKKKERWGHSALFFNYLWLWGVFFFVINIFLYSFFYKIKSKLNFFSSFCVFFPFKLSTWRHGPAGRPSPTGSWSSQGRREFWLRKFWKRKRKTEENCVWNKGMNKRKERKRERKKEKKKRGLDR